jgi:hypothetical protein
MTEQELKKLEMNLTKSAMKAKKGYVRCMIGHTESEQGFAPIEALYVFNPVKNNFTPLAEVIEDLGILAENHRKLQESHDSLQNDYDFYKEQQSLRELQIKKELDAKFAELDRVINEIVEVL